MSPTPPGRCSCAVCTAEAALPLLRTGRPAMAMALLKPPPALIREAQAEAWSQSVDAGGLPSGQPRR